MAVRSGASWTWLDRKAGLPDDAINRAFQLFLAADPTAGDVIRDTGGLRKVRWNCQARRKGKRGGTRVIYYDADAQVFLLTIYAKGVKDDLSAAERKALQEDA